MAEISKGILGGISGTVGPVVGGNWNGIDYVRSKSTRRKDKPTEAQVVHRAKFSVVSKFIKALHGLLMVSFKIEKRKTGSNSGLSYTIQNAVTGNYPAFKLDYSLVLVSRGSLPNVSNPTASAGVQGVISFQWQDNSGTGSAKSNDKAILVAYCEELNMANYKTAGADRSAGADSLMNPAFSGKQVQTWIAFASARSYSDSIYTGSLSVQ